MAMNEPSNSTNQVTEVYFYSYAFISTFCIDNRSQQGLYMTNKLCKEEQGLEQPSVREVPSLIPRCGIKSFFRLFPCSFI